jgi:hypothetical protein
MEMNEKHFLRLCEYHCMWNCVSTDHSTHEYTTNVRQNNRVPEEASAVELQLVSNNVTHLQMLIMENPIGAKKASFLNKNSTPIDISMRPHCARAHSC